MNWKERFDEKFRNEDYLCGGCGECEACLLWAKPFKLFITQERILLLEEIKGEVEGMKKEELDNPFAIPYNRALTDTLSLLDKYISKEV